MRLPIVLAACALCACGDASKNSIDLTVGAAALEPAKRDSVRTLTIDVVGAITASKSYDVVGLRPEERLELLPSISSGALTITVTAIDDRTNVVGRGTVADVMLTGNRVRVGVTLNPVGPPAIAITPPRAKVTRTRSQRFTADRPVTWAVTAGAGTIDSDGLYTAPDAPGAATLTATLSTDETVSVTVPIEIADYGIELLAGAPDGPGWADGIGGNGRFAQPGEMVATSAGDVLYVVERDWCLVRKIVVATSEVTTLAGHPEDCRTIDGPKGAARVAYPSALALDEGAGLLYVAETGALRAIRLSDGELSTPFVGPLGFVGGMVKHPTQPRLYLSRKNHHTIGTIDLSGSTFITIAGTAAAAGSSDGTGTAASFRSPRGVATDGQALFIADNGNFTIRRLDLTTQEVTTVAGSAGMSGATDGGLGTSRLLGPTGMAFANGAIRFADSSTTTDSNPALVRTFVLANNSVSTMAGHLTTSAPNSPIQPAPSANAPGVNASFADLYGLALTNSMIYVSERNLGTIRSITISGNNATATLAGAPAKYGSTDGAGMLARFWYPASVVIIDGVAHLTDNSNATIRSIDLMSGQVRTTAGVAGVRGAIDGPTADARFQRPEALIAIGNTLYIGDGNDSSIRALDLTTSSVSLLAGEHGASGSSDGVGGAARFGYPLYLATDGVRTLYVVDGVVVRSIDTVTKEVKTIAGTSGEFSAPYGIAYEQGMLYVCDGTAFRIHALNPTTHEVTTFLGGTESKRVDGTGDAVRFINPSILVGNGKGTLYVVDAGAIRQVDIATRTATTLIGRPEIERTLRIGPLPGSVFAPGGIALDASGDIILTDNVTAAVVRIRIPKP